MGTFVEAPKAWWLTHGMARTAGVSLPRAVSSGWLTRRELARMVERCQACPASEKCSGWLAMATGIESPPDYCCNKTVIETLATLTCPGHWSPPDEADRACRFGSRI